MVTHLVDRVHHGPGVNGFPAAHGQRSPSMALGQAFLAAIVSGVAGILTAVMLARAGSRAAFATRLALAGCAIATAISLAL